MVLPNTTGQIPSLSIIIAPLYSLLITITVLLILTTNKIIQKHTLYSTEDNIHLFFVVLALKRLALYTNVLVQLCVRTLQCNVTVGFKEPLTGTVCI